MPNPDEKQKILSNIATGFINRLGESQAEPKKGLTDLSMPAPETPSAQQVDHSEALRQAAEAAKLKYMQDNGVDENGQPVAQKRMPAAQAPN